MIFVNKDMEQCNKTNCKDIYLKNTQIVRRACKGKSSAFFTSLIESINCWISEGAINLNEFIEFDLALEDNGNGTSDLILNGISIGTVITELPDQIEVTSDDNTVDITETNNIYDLSVTHTENPDGSITLNDGTIIPADGTSKIEKQQDGTYLHFPDDGSSPQQIKINAYNGLSLDVSNNKLMTTELGSDENLPSGTDADFIEDRNIPLADYNLSFRANNVDDTVKTTPSIEAPIMKLWNTGDVVWGDETLSGTSGSGFRMKWNKTRGSLIGGLSMTSDDGRSPLGSIFWGRSMTTNMTDQSYGLFGGQLGIYANRGIANVFWGTQLQITNNAQNYSAIFGRFNRVKSTVTNFTANLVHGLAVNFENEGDAQANHIFGTFRFNIEGVGNIRYNNLIGRQMRTSGSLSHNFGNLDVNNYSGVGADADYIVGNLSHGILNFRSNHLDKVQNSSYLFLQGSRLKIDGANNSFIKGNKIFNDATNVFLVNGGNSNISLISTDPFAIENHTPNKWITVFPNGYELHTSDLVGGVTGVSGVSLAPAGNAWASISDENAKIILEQDVDYKKAYEVFKETSIKRYRLKAEENYRETELKTIIEIQEVVDEDAYIDSLNYQGFIDNGNNTSGVITEENLDEFLSGLENEEQVEFIKEAIKNRDNGGKSVRQQVKDEVNRLQNLTKEVEVEKQIQEPTEVNPLENVEHIGWTVQDFNKILGNMGYDELKIEAPDAVGVLAAIIKGLSLELEELKSKL